VGLSVTWANSVSGISEVVEWNAAADLLCVCGVLGPNVQLGEFSERDGRENGATWSGCILRGHERDIIPQKCRIPSAFFVRDVDLS
jgi:hypothetical protein